MRRLFRTCLLIACACLLAATALAAIPFQAGEGSTAPAVTPESEKCLTVWCQEPTNDFIIGSHISETPAEVVTQIADFTPATDEAATMMKWWGAVFGGPGPLEHFVITFYRSGGCTGPSGAAIYERIIHDWTEQDYDGDLLEYVATFDPVPMDAGASYWVSVQAVIQIDPAGYWGWCCSDVVLCPAMVTAPSYGVIDWTPAYPNIFPDLPEVEERAFCLYTDGAVITEVTNWGAVKALYR